MEWPTVFLQFRYRDMGATGSLIGNPRDRPTQNGPAAKTVRNAALRGYQKHVSGVRPRPQWSGGF